MEEEMEEEEEEEEDKKRGMRWLRLRMYSVWQMTRRARRRYLPSAAASRERSPRETCSPGSSPQHFTITIISPLVLPKVVNSS